MATSQLRSPAGIALTTALQTVYTCPAAGHREIVQVTFNNIDGVNDALVSNCNWLNAAASNASLAILPVNAKVAKQDNLTITKTLSPGDVIQANASANGDIVAIIEIIGREPA